MVTSVLEDHTDIFVSMQKVEEIFFFQAFVTLYQSTQHYMPEACSLTITTVKI
jgi:hypothetical protein